MKTHYLGQWQYWYDRSTRCWWAATFDSEGNQTCPAIDAYTKAEIIQSIKIQEEQ